MKEKRSHTDNYFVSNKDYIRMHRKAKRQAWWESNKGRVLLTIVAINAVVNVSALLMALFR